MAARKKRLLTHPYPKVSHSRRYVKDNGFFTLLLTSSSAWSIKEPSIQTPERWLFWDISLPCFQSACFPNKVVFLASTPSLQFYYPVVQQAEWACTHSLSVYLVSDESLLPGYLFSICSHRFSLMWGGGWLEIERAKSIPLFKKALILSWGTHPHDLI